MHRNSAAEGTSADDVVMLSNRSKVMLALVRYAVIVSEPAAT
jgi:hypothetical protein